MTLALPKAGLRSPEAESRVGELYLADIGVPPALYEQPSIGICVGGIFSVGDVVRLI
jgi:NAD(P)H-hydrate epimerase